MRWPSPFFSGVEKDPGTKSVLEGRWLQKFTPQKFSIAPDKLPSQWETSLPTTIFQGLC